MLIRVPLRFIAASQVPRNIGQGCMADGFLAATRHALPHHLYTLPDEVRLRLIDCAIFQISELFYMLIIERLIELFCLALLPFFHN